MKTTEGFTVADSRNLPQVDYFMLLQYMQESDNYNAAEIRGAKALVSSRDAYIESAVGYVEIKRENLQCIVKCRVTPEHKISSKMYTVIATISEIEEKIVEVTCQDCAAAQGGCKHSICLVMWLIKKMEEPSLTSVNCYWKKPRLSEAVTKDKYVLAKNINPKRRLQTPENVGPTLESFLNECKNKKLQNVLLLNYEGQRELRLNDFTVFNLMHDFCNDNTNFDFQNFKEFVEAKLTCDISRQIEEKTLGQVSEKLWHSMRQNRVTASRIYEASRCTTENGALVQTIMGGYKVPETAAIRRGRKLEREVIKQIEVEINECIHPSGFILVNSIMGASPDGLCKDFVIEVKCPASKKAMTNYIKNNELEKKFKAQIMLQMHAAKKMKGLFVVADPEFEINKITHKYWVDMDKDYVSNLIKKDEEFWRNYIFPKILSGAK